MAQASFVAHALVAQASIDTISDETWCWWVAQCIVQCLPLWMSHCMFNERVIKAMCYIWYTVHMWYVLGWFAECVGLMHDGHFLRDERHTRSFLYLRQSVALQWKPHKLSPRYAYNRIRIRKAAKAHLALATNDSSSDCNQGTQYWSTYCVWRLESSTESLNFPVVLVYVWLMMFKLV